jgi:uncharacterized protein YhfF
MDDIITFWRNFLDTLPPEERPDGDPPPAWGFGNNPHMADELGTLVKTGIKTATCSLLWEHEADNEPLPQRGEYSIILNGSGKPLCIIQTTGVMLRPFSRVDALHAWEEGEGDRSIKHWRDVHWRHFSPLCTLLGHQPDENMPLVCERFRRVFP